MGEVSGRRRRTRAVVGLLACAALLTSAAAPAPGRPSGTDAGPRSTPAAARVVQAGVTYARGRALDVYRAHGEGRRPSTGLPVVLMVHGCCGDRADLGKLAEATAGAGALVLAADWAGTAPDGRWREAYEEVGCAVRFARARAAAYGGDPRRVVLLGWSDGALPASVVALAGDRFSAARCAEPTASPRPDAVLGVAGFYGWELPVASRYVTDRAAAFLGGTPSSAAESWREATAHSWLARRGPRCWVLVVGATDPLAEDARRFARALAAAGHRTRLVVAPPAGDQTMISPRSGEGRATVREALSSTRC